MVILMSKQTSLNRILNNIITDVRKTTKAALEYAGQKVSDDLGRMAYFALDRYYSEYTKPPRIYKRTNELMDNSYYKINKRTGVSVSAGVKFDENLMNHPKAGISEHAILENFMVGIHGFEGVYDSISYRNVMDKYYKSYKERGKPYGYFNDYMNNHLNH